MKCKRKSFSSCPNCGYSFQSASNFCASCGQENNDLNIPLKHLIGELLEHTLHLDSKSFTTIKALIFKPGFLTSEFNSGKRKSYVSPLRLYIFVSFVFFLILNLSWQEYKTPEEINRENKFKLSFTFFNLNSNELIGLTESQTESLMAVRNIERNKYNLYAVKQLHRITNGGAEDFYHLLIKNISYSMFVLMPLFALLLSIFYKGQNKYYIGYLVHSLHIHTFGFVVLSLFFIISKIVSSIFITLGLIIILILYFIISQSKTYNQTRLKTFLKTVAITILYLILILATILIATWIIVLLF
ncbi:MAG: DUF3667 domain-containing protein [Ignavibacteriales bacterium]|nr:DUF3667 domain-containing protein [Ignavibacteriales bacterium]